MEEEEEEEEEGVWGECVCVRGKGEVRMCKWGRG